MSGQGYKQRKKERARQRKAEAKQVNKLTITREDEEVKVQEITGAFNDVVTVVHANYLRIVAQASPEGAKATVAVIEGEEKTATITWNGKSSEIKFEGGGHAEG